MRINFDFADLEAFLAVKETESFQLASVRLNLSQSAVTRRVQKLEAALGTALFHRSTRSVRPTLAAKRLEARARALLEDAWEASGALRDESIAFAYQRSSLVTLALVPTVASSLLAPALDLLRQRDQNVRVQLLDGSANEVAERVAQGDADFGICSIPKMEPNTEFEVLFEEEIGVVLNDAKPLAKKKALHWGDLKGQPLILPARGTGNRLLIDEARAKGGHSMEWTIETNRSTTALDLVATGQGIAILPESAMASAQGHNLTFRPFARPKISRVVGILERFGQPETAAVKLLKDALKEVSKP